MSVRLHQLVLEISFLEQCMTTTKVPDNSWGKMFLMLSDYPQVGFDGIVGLLEEITHKLGLMESSVH